MDSINRKFDPNNGWDVNNVWDLAQLVDECLKTINERIRGLKKLNIIVAGKTGAGKSTLINSVFRKNLATTGEVEPVTMHMQMYSEPDLPLRIYDTRGLELGRDAQMQVKREIIDKIRDGAGSNNIDDHIHCIWYCINTASSRVEEEELRWLAELSDENNAEHVPIIVILTQAFDKEKAHGMESYIRNKNLHICQVVPVLAQSYSINGEYTVQAYGLDTLIEIMENTLPKELKDSMYNVLNGMLPIKVKRAQAIVAGVVATTFGVGFAPIPFADAAVLIPIQVGMIAGITAVFGLNLSKGVITSFVSSVFGAGGMTIVGKTVVSNLLKLVPGVGTAFGGVISGGTASLLTTALGEAYIQLMIAIYKGELKASEINTEKGKKRMRQLIHESIKKQKH